MESPQVFVIATFDPDGQLVRDAVRRAVEENGFGVIQSSDAIHDGAVLTRRILDSIRKADLIIADVSERNPNVLYEAGFAEALRKPIILLVSEKSAARLPSDLVGLRFIFYHPTDLVGLADAVRSETKALRRWSARLSA